MRQRVIVGTKLAETVCRGLFILVATYRLPVVDAGQFGLIATLVGIGAFLVGFERQVDLLRCVSGSPAAEVRQRLSETFRFHAVNAWAVLPWAALLGSQAFGWSATTLALALLILVGEYAGNQAYQAVLVDRRHYPLMALGLARVATLLAATLGWAWLSPATFDAEGLLLLWSGLSAVFLPILAWLWIVAMRPAGPASNLPVHTIGAQYRASALHFSVGLAAMAALQADRLVVGSLLNPFDIGIFFRHVTLAGLALQLFNIASYNRVAPTVYLRVRQANRPDALRIVKVEYLRFAVALGLACAALSAGVAIADNVRSATGLVPAWIALLGVAVMLRGGADYAGLVLLAVGADRRLLANQCAAVLVGVVLLILLARAYGVFGAVLGSIATPLIYICLNLHAIRSSESA
ncbi:MAG: hypothetical protein ACKVQR_04770 [Aquabacterium sp.]